MHFVENKKYRIVQCNSFEIYAMKRHGVVNIYAKDCDREFLWLDDDYIDAKLLLKEDECYPAYCYLMLTDEFTMCTIVEIMKKKLVKCFNDFALVKMYKRNIDIDCELVQDVVLVLWNRDDRLYSVWSLREGYLFEPYEYEDISTFSCGAILDNKLSVDDQGWTYDISSYEELCGNVYYSKENDDYIYFVNHQRMLFVPMSNDENDEDIVKVELDSGIVKYNKETNHVSYGKTYEEYTDWSQYNDIAFEGNSRLELGLDD